MSEAAFMVDLPQTAEPEVEEEPSSGRGSSCSSDSLFHLLNPQVSGLKDEREVWGSFPSFQSQVSSDRRWSYSEINMNFASAHEEVEEVQKTTFQKIFFFLNHDQNGFFLTQSLVCVCVCKRVSVCASKTIHNFMQ